jgi:plasmid stabilization system protein ParE
MSLRVEKSEFFVLDFAVRFDWYEDQGGPELAFRFQRALTETLLRLAQRPDLGRVRRLRQPPGSD